MRTYDFTIHFSCPGDLQDSLMDQFYEAGCRDALIGESSGQKFADFHREGESFADAVISALESLSRVSGVSVDKVESEDHPDRAETINRALLIRH